MGSAVVSGHGRAAEPGRAALPSSASRVPDAGRHNGRHAESAASSLRTARRRAARGRRTGRTGDAGGRGIGCVVAHGFTGSSRNAARAAASAAALVADGHRRARARLPRARPVGRAAARPAPTRSTTSRPPSRGCAARATAFVAVLGWSMGGTAVLRLRRARAATPTPSSASARRARGSSAAPGRCGSCTGCARRRTGRPPPASLRRTRLSADGWVDRARGAGRGRRRASRRARC